MARKFDKSAPGRMSFHEIAREVRRRSGNRSKPSDIQIVNAIGIGAARPHWLVPKTFEHLSWDVSNSIAAEDAEEWMTRHLVPCFAALQAEWDDRKTERRSRKGWQNTRLARLREIGYAAFKAEFKALHKERYTRRDVDGWLLRKYRNWPGIIPAPKPPKKKKAKPTKVFPADAPTITVTTIANYPGDKWRPLAVYGPDYLVKATLRSGQLFRIIGAPDAKPKTLAVRIKWPSNLGRVDDELILKRNEFHAGWGYQGELSERVG